MRKSLAVLVLAAAGCGGSPPPPAPVAPAARDPAVAPRGADVAWESKVGELFASMPEPSAERAFTFDGEIEFGVPERGSLHLDVRPGEFDGHAAWRVVQDEVHPKFPNGQPASAEHTETWLSRDLRVLGGTTTIVGDDVVHATRVERASARTISFAAALIYFRACPAEVTAEADPVPYPVVSRVDDDGTMLCTAFTSDMSQVFVTLRGSGRTPVEVKRFLGWHNMGTIVAREPK